MENSSEILFAKLDEFIFKYYKNKIIRGILIAFLILSLYIISISVAEYYSYFSIPVRRIIFYFSFSLIIFIIIYYIVIPTLKRYKIGKILSYQQAAEIISIHFPEIQDKLRNTLEFIALSSTTQNELIFASIDQRISNLKPLPFSTVVNFKSNYIYLKYLAFLFLIFTPLFIFYPTIFTSGAKRIINHDTFFMQEAPFSFDLQETVLEVEKGNDFTFILKLHGEYIPQKVEIMIGSTSFYMQKMSSTTFSYTAKEINNSFDFNFQADNYQSKKYFLTVLPSPQLQSFILSAKVPEYTGEKDFNLQNIGDVTVPCGTKITWKFSTMDVTNLYIHCDDSNNVKTNKVDNKFEASLTLKKSLRYSIVTSNDYVKQKSLISYAITVVPDLYPSIDVVVKADSITNLINYYKGVIKDDYGFSKLVFKYFAEDKKDSIYTVPLQISLNNLSQDFYYISDFSKLKPGTIINYYFEVFDNDAINGHKSTKSTLSSIKVPTNDEVRKLDNQISKDIEKDVDKSIQIDKQIKKDIETLQQKLLNQDISQYEKNQLMDKLQDKHNQLLNLVNEITQQNLKKNELMKNQNEQNSEILEKQKEIEKLMNSLMDDEFKKMLDEYRKMMEKFDKDKIFDKTNDMKVSYEELEKQLDRNLELLKRMDIEKNIQNAIEKLDELKQQQDELIKKLENNGISKEDAAQKQKELNEQKDKLEQDYKKTMKNNEELQKKMDMKPFDSEFSKLSQTMSQSVQQMNEGSKSKSKKEMQESSKEMKDLSEKMNSMMQNNKQKENEEDISQLKQILDNILTLSFKQEDLLKKFRKTIPTDPTYISNLNEQVKLVDDFSIIRDSLGTLAKRQPKISTPINKEIVEIEKDFKKIKSGFDSRNTFAINSNQQFVMTSLNNLSLFLSEILQNMQNSQKSQSPNNSPSSKQCKNPRKGQGSSLSEMKSQQQTMKKQLQQMLNQMKQAGNATQLNKELSQMLSQQEKYEQMLGDLIKNGNLSPEATNQLNEIKQLMDQNQKDIVNKRINPETINRQNNILTRLLDAENAEKQRGTEEKRESKEGKQNNLSNPKDFFKYKNNNTGSKEVIEYQSIRLNSFYKKKYDEYLLNITK